MDARLTLAGLLVGTACLVGAAPQVSADQARVLDLDGRVLTVGNWYTTIGDGGFRQRTLSNDLLSWELHDGSRLVGAGLVPGTADPWVDASPSVSRNPATGDILLAWSRANTEGRSEIVTMPFRFDGSVGEWVAAETTVVASGASNQTNPFLIHDALGTACIVWRSMDWDQKVMLLMVTADGRTIAQQELSAGRSVFNGRPKLGVDTAGQVFAAFLGSDLVSRKTTVYVLATLAMGGGILHLPNPIVEMSLRASVALPEVSLPPAGPSPNVNLTVLGGTPIAWWTEVDPMTGRLLFKHLDQDPDSDWLSSRVGTIDLTAGIEGGIPEVLELLEARLRRVNSRFDPNAPQLPSPVRSDALSLRRRLP